MAKIYDQPIDKNTSWDGDESTGNQPVKGTRVEEFIKETLENKAGEFYYDTTNNRYLVFADAENKDKYLQDTSQNDLIIGTFDAPFNYSAEITLETETYNAISADTTGNYIDFTFTIKNKNGQPTGENVICTYTFKRGSVKQTIIEQYSAGKNVHFNIDKYLNEGTNTITIAVQGVTSLAATTAAITYEVVNLSISTELDISNVYNLSEGTQTVAVPFYVSGYGTKTVEWYLDGTKLDFVKNEDEVVEVSVSRTKYITLSNLQQGVHSLQTRVYTLVNGEQFYSNTLYNEIIVFTNTNQKTITAISTVVPSENGIINTRKFYGITQYVPYTLTFATYTPSSKASVEVEIKLNGVTQGTITSQNNTVNEFIIAPSASGEATVQFITKDSTSEVSTVIGETTMNITEITNDLQLDFRAVGKSNNATDKDSWTYGSYKGTFTGFNWNNTSGWVDNTLYLNSGASFGIDLAPLSPNPSLLGKTIEIEFATYNIQNDDAVICDLRNDQGTGVLITATKISLTSDAGTVIETPFKDSEFNRFAFVINKTSGSTNKCMSFIYANGKYARGTSWASTDKYTSDRQILFKSTDEAQVKIKAIRIYNTALTSDQILNNYILYRDNIIEMNDIYERNDIYTEGTNTFDDKKMASRLPVMVITGNVPILENTTDKNEQIVVDAEYSNLQTPTLNFNWKSAAFRPQGTSSMGYPKKNFRIYSDRLTSTICYDSNGKLVSDRLYAFKENSQRVNCWCLKADYAESSGTHNTGIARLWNDVLYNATLDGEHVFRTKAQEAALKSGFDKDVRTTIDGFPILLFYRLTENDPLIFIGKYNFNNDKSTPSVFGFENIPGFDNSKTQCWEVLNNGSPLALFTSSSDFDSKWATAFESRYPDVKVPDTSALKTFCQWMSSVTQNNFKTQKWQHLDVYKVAAYYIYLMRFGAVDQTVKNAMLTTEDGTTWFYINYDNDTINGLTNEGKLVVPWNAVRATLGSDGEPYYAGSQSRLWNMLEADDEFMSVVRKVDEALYTAGLKYSDVIDMFDNKQASKWVERVYNQDAQYKYIGPFVENGVDNLFMLQGDRSTHRKYWLAKRFNYFDSKFVSGAYKAQSIELKCINNTPSGQKITITAGTEMDYGYGINNVVHESNIPLSIGEFHTFTTTETVNLGDPIRIYTAPNIEGLDLSAMSDRLAVITVDKVYDEALGTKLKKLIIGNAVKENVVVETISGLSSAQKLEYLDVRNMKNITYLDLSNQNNIQYVDITGSGIANIEFAKGSTLQTFKMTSAMQALKLENLPYLTTLASENNFQTLRSISIKDCPYITKDFTFVYNWMRNTQLEVDKLELQMTGVYWTSVSPEDLISLGSIGSINLKGRVEITTATQEQLDEIAVIFGSKCFERDSEFYVVAPDGIFISSANSVRGGHNIEFTAAVFSENIGTVTWSIISGSSYASITSSSGFSCVVKTQESSYDTRFTIQARHVPSGAGDVVYIAKEVTITKVTRVGTGSISGSSLIGDLEEYKFVPIPSNYDEPYTVTWSLTGTAATSGYVNIISQNNESCKVQLNSGAPTSTFSVDAHVDSGRGSFVISKTVTIGVKFTLYITSNQSGDQSTFSNVSATVEYGHSSTTLKNGGELSVSSNTTIKVTFPSVTNYKTPTDLEFVIGSENITKTGTYLAEQVEVNVFAENGGDVTGATITINDIEYTWEGIPITAKIAFDEEYTVVGNYMQGFYSIDSSFVASQASRVANIVYAPLPKDVIVINQTISDPDTMISGAVNNDTIKAIRSGSHRYLGKYTSEGIMTLCQLDDSDSTKFIDGTDADLTGTQGDVFMKMPNFFYRSLRIQGDDVVGLQFKLGTESPGEDWNEWDTNALIAVYEVCIIRYIPYSISGVKSSTSNYTSFKRYSNERGTGFQLVDWQMHCVMAILFYAQYGHTDSQKKIGVGTASADKVCGVTNTYGMNDTKGDSPVAGLNDAGEDGNTNSINYWGLENWWGNKSEYMDNVTGNGGFGTAFITEFNGNTYAIPVFQCNSITKIKFGKKCDIVPLASSTASTTTGFCDQFVCTAAEYQRSFYNAYTNGGVAYVGAFSEYPSSRLAFRGKCIIESNPTTFKSLTAIG